MFGRIKVWWNKIEKEYEEKELLREKEREEFERQEQQRSLTRDNSLQFQIVKEYSKEDLESRVGQLIERGYKPVGGISTSSRKSSRCSDETGYYEITCTTYMQSMSKL